MTCRNVAQLRDRHLDGELSASLSAEVHAHLLQCPACQRQFEMYRAAGEVIARDRSEPALPSDFATRLLAAIAEAPRPIAPAPIQLQTRRALRERFWRLAVSVSVPAAAAMLFLAVLIWPVSEPSGPGGIVAGVSVRATDAVGVNQVAAPAVNAMAETVRVANSLSQMQRLLAEQARQGGEAKAPSLAPKPEITLLNALLFPFNESFAPDAGPQTDESKDDGLVRF